MRRVGVSGTPVSIVRSDDSSVTENIQLGGWSEGVWGWKGLTQAVMYTTSINAAPRPPPP